jgi:murein DD-endopeptidase MepM/ murein hydrolase activator NlpD
MRTAAALPRHLVYIVEHSKFEAGVVFYGVMLALVLQLSSLARTARLEHGFMPISLPYVEISPHGTPLKPLASVTTASVTAASVAVAIPVPVGGQTWPIHGRVTTEFGAPDYPYQSHHTGIDITSARPAGTTPVAAFRAGTVTAVIHSYSSYGNHIIVDHGSGLTSLYGHLYSTSVSVGQQVKAGETIGTEGSTGASTGPHVHFEIRQNDVPQNPRRYLPSSP